MCHVSSEKILKMKVQQKVHRKRGRPPKHKEVAGRTISMVHSQELHRKRGRKPKRCVLADNALSVECQQDVNPKPLAAPEKNFPVQELHHEHEQPSKTNVVSNNVLEQVHQKRVRQLKNSVLTERVFPVECQQQLIHKHVQPTRSPAVPEKPLVVGHMQEFLHECKQSLKPSVVCVEGLKENIVEEVRRKRGRPPKLCAVSEMSIKTSSKGHHLDHGLSMCREYSENVLKRKVLQEVRRKRGRPPKLRAVSEMSRKTSSKGHHLDHGLSMCHENSENVLKRKVLQEVRRKRGRPPKRFLPTERKVPAECQQESSHKLEQSTKYFPAPEEIFTMGHMHERYHECEQSLKSNIVIYDVSKVNVLEEVRRKRGRPPKLRAVSEMSCKTSSKGHHLDHGLSMCRENSENVLKRNVLQEVRRKRGRPPKFRAVSEMSCKTSSKGHHIEHGLSMCRENSENVLKRKVLQEVRRKCGRPPKRFLPTERKIPAECQQELSHKLEHPTEYSPAPEEIFTVGHMHERYHECKQSLNPNIVINDVPKVNVLEDVHRKCGQSPKSHSVSGMLSKTSFKGLHQKHGQSMDCFNSEKVSKSKVLQEVRRKRGRPPKHRVVTECTISMEDMQEVHKKFGQPPKSCALAKEFLPVEYQRDLHYKCTKLAEVSQEAFTEKDQQELHHEWEQSSENCLRRDVLEVVHRKRGRPAKPRLVSEMLCENGFKEFHRNSRLSSLHHAITEKCITMEAMQIVHQRRGRPPKLCSVSDQPRKISFEGLCRKRGRPPKCSVISVKPLKVNNSVEEMHQKLGRPTKPCDVFDKSLKKGLKNGLHQNRQSPRHHVISDGVKMASLPKVPVKRGRPRKLCINSEKEKNSTVEIMQNKPESYFQLLDEEMAGNCRLWREKKLPARHEESVLGKELQFFLQDEVLRNGKNQEQGLERADVQKYDTSENTEQVMEGSADFTTEQKIILELEHRKPHQKHGCGQKSLPSPDVTLDRGMQMGPCGMMPDPVASEITSKFESLENLPPNFSPNSSRVAEEFLNTLGLQRLHHQCGRPSKSTLVQVQKPLNLRYWFRGRQGPSAMPPVVLQKTVMVGGIPKLLQKRGRPPKLGTICVKPVKKEEEVTRRKPGRPRKSCVIVPEEISKIVSPTRQHENCGWPLKPCAVCRGHPLRTLGLKYLYKKRGRPPKSHKTIITPVNVGKPRLKRGRPPKSCVTNEMAINTDIL